MTAPQSLPTPEPTPATRTFTGAWGRIALSHGIVCCPACQRKAFYIRLRAGEQWMQCNHERLERRGACAARWLNVTLPAGSTGHDLARLTGGPSAEADAVAILRILFPELARATDAQLLCVVVAPGTAQDPQAPTHLQVVVRARDEYHARWAPLHQVLRHTGVLMGQT